MVRGLQPIRQAISETHKIRIPGPWRGKLNINKLLLSSVCLLVFRIFIKEDKRLDGRRLYIKQLSTHDFFGEEQAPSWMSVLIMESDSGVFTNLPTTGAPSRLGLHCNNEI